MRADIPIPDQIVQVGHACMEAAWRFPRPELPCHLVALAVPSQVALYDALGRLDAAGIDYVAFDEPDDGMGHTAACTAPLVGAARRLFRRYPLWRCRDP